MPRVSPRLLSGRRQQSSGGSTIRQTDAPARVGPAAEQRGSLSERQFEDFVDACGVDLLAVARRFSANAADAEDVYQSTLVTILTRAPTSDRGQLMAWAKTVARNIAISELRRASGRSETEFDEELVTADSEIPDDTLTTLETSAILGSAIRGIRADHARCLLLRADELTYPEICELTGFSYAKVNRCLSEGRQALADRFTRIESGSDCDRLAGALSAYADGAADGERAREVELHLRSCVRCKSTLREYRAVPRRVAAAFPVGEVVAGDPGLVDRLLLPFRRTADLAQNAVSGAQELVLTRSTTLQPLLEAATAKKLAALAGVSASMLAAGAGVQELRSSTASYEAAPASALTQQLPRPTSGIGGQTGSSDAEDAAEKAEDEPESLTAADAENFGDNGELDGSEVPADVGDFGQSAPGDGGFEAPSGTNTDQAPGSGEEFPELAP